MVDNFPSAIFGKPEDASAYQIIEQDKEFEVPKIAKAFREICHSFEWKPLPTNVQHPPCHATIRLGATILIARYTDAGRDNVGRPHTLRVECVLTDPDRLAVAWARIGDQPIPNPASSIEFIGDARSFTVATRRD